MNKRLWVHLALLLVGIIYGLNYGLAKIVMPTYIGAFGFINMRVLSAALLFTVLHFFVSKERISDRRDYLRLFGLAAMGVAANQLLFFKGLSLTSPIHASLIMTTLPIIVLLFSLWLNKEKPTGYKIGGVLLGASGAILLLLSGEIDWGNAVFAGDIMILLNATTYGYYLVKVKPLMAKYQALTVVKWVFLFGALLVLPFGWSELQAVSWSQLPGQIWWIIAFVILGVTFLTYLLNTWALSYVNSSVVGVYAYIQPVFATLIAIILKQDQLDLPKILFSLLIFAGVFLATKK